ncbi:23060_t:CDS:10 [Dentiscutata erythropus]|uniref:Structural maintenance of chromosomes protein 6 n=1 Tax=Dentiscutata erythropus TaxID=1348616 RepID=A0A9N8VFI5_9GLOM|nr:23060_t:CDS:10 [Dentiscutata erythropus]
MPAGKRVRRTVFSDSETEEAEIAEEEPRQTRSSSKRARQSATEEIRARRSATEEINGFPDEMSFDEDTYFEDDDFGRESAEELERTKLRRKSSTGVIAESSVIESIELLDFMCHKFLKVNFGPKINFIIGHNGSGKSAILTGITVCLGGKANVTNRASNLKSLIREGASVAQVTLKLRNRGADAYRHEVYGDSIVIERRISRDGSNGYKIKTSGGKVVSGKREELNAILDHMAIQVDNPMNVLSQDTARQFLHSSSPEDKYKFFMKGTQLTQLSEDYELIRESIETTQNIIKHKKEVLPDLLRAAKDAEARYKDMQKARELELTVAGLKDQMAWAQVEEKEQEVAESEANLLKARRRLPTVQARLDQEQAKFDEINLVISELEQRLHEHATITQPLQNRKKELQIQVKEKAKQLREIHKEEREINDFIKNLKHSVETYRSKINEEALKLQEDNRQKREYTLNAVRERENEVNMLTQERHELLTKTENLVEKIEHIKNEKRSITHNILRSEDEIQRQNELIQQLRDQKSDNLKAFGPSIPDVLNAINHETRWRKKPVGPFGRYIKLTKPEWRNTLESVIGHSLTAFSVSNHHDQQLLSGILKRFHCNSPIIVGEDDHFDYSSGEPSSHENVKRRLIIQHHIESVILVEKRAEADLIMNNDGRGFPYNVSACYTVDGFKVGHRGGGYLTQSIYTYRGPARFTQDIDAQIRDTQEKIKDATFMRNRYITELRRADVEIDKANQEHREIQNKINEYQRRGKQLNNEIIQLKEDLQEDEPANIAALEEAIREAEIEIEQYKRNYASLQEQKVQLDNELLPLVTEIEEVSKRLNDMSSEVDVLNEQIEEQVSMRVTCSNNKTHWERKLIQEQQKINVVEEEVKNKKAVLEDWTKQAEDYCPERVEVTKPANELDREIKQIQNRLREREKEQGSSLEEIASDMKAKGDDYRHAKTEIGHMENFTKDLKSALHSRMQKWRNFRTFISVRARIQFTYQLSKRGYTGKLLFEHQNKRLNLRVQIEEQTNQSSDKDPKSLSGGEKSFSTICLLLALWEAMGSDCTQYILITPQDASNVSPGPDVRVHRLQDPERGQGILNQ